jgi:transcriptional regulator of acetoin/glycerol metabolism
VLYRAAVAAPSETIGSQEVEAALATSSKGRARSLSQAEAKALLSEHQGNVSAAARSAGVARSTFRSWIGAT